MSGADFFDSNVFIYLFDPNSDRKRRIARELIDRAIENGNGCVSWQVVQETLNVITRKIARSATAQEAEHFLRAALMPHWHVQPSATLYVRGLRLHERLGFSFYDSLIVSAALEAGCKRLLTEDLQDGQQIEGLTIENPFKE